MNRITSALKTRPVKTVLTVFFCVTVNFLGRHLASAPAFHYILEDVIVIED